MSNHVKSIHVETAKISIWIFVHILSSRADMRLTRKQMEEIYPNQWLGLKNVIYKNDDGVTMESAEVVYTDKSKEELLKMQIAGTYGIIGWYTTEEGMMLGMAGVI